MELQEKNKNDMLLFAIFAIGIILRIFKLGDQSVWIHEFYTARFAANKNLFAVFWNALANDMHPPTFYVLEHIFCGIFGFSEVSLRVLPLCFGITNMFIFYKLVRAFFSEQISLIAAFLFCLSPYQIYYSQEARNYTMFLMVSMFITYYFIISIKYNSFVFGKFVFWSVIGIYTHSFTILLLVIINGVLFILYREEIRLNLWIKAQAIIAVFMLPMLIFYLKGFFAQTYYNNIGMLLAPFHALKNYLFGITIDWNILTIAAFITAIYLIIMGIFTYRQKYSKIVKIISWISISFMMLSWLISLVLAKPMFSERLFILVSALVLIILAVGISYLSDQGIALAVIVVTIIYSIAFFNYYFVEKYQKSNYKSQFLQIEKDWKDGDIIVHSSACSYASFEFYNSIMYRTNFQNRILGEVPEFSGSVLRLKIREMWRWLNNEVLKRKYNIDIYAGYDKNTLTTKEAAENIKKYKRVWFIRDNPEGEKQIWLPVGYMWNSNMKIEAPSGVGKTPWVSKYFKISKEQHFYPDDIFLLVAK